MATATEQPSSNSNSRQDGQDDHRIPSLHAWTHILFILSILSILPILSLPLYAVAVTVEHAKGSQEPRQTRGARRPRSPSRARRTLPASRLRRPRNWGQSQDSDLRGTTSPRPRSLRTWRSA